MTSMELGPANCSDFPLQRALAILVRAREKHLLEKKDAIGNLELLARFGRYRGSIIRDAKSKLEGSHD